MGYRYINNLATQENIEKFLELVDLAAGTDKDTDNVFAIGEKLSNSKAMARCLKSLQKDPASVEMLRERYIGPPYDLEAMLKMPKHSLGWTYAKIMSVMNYDPQFYPSRDSFENDAQYVNFRMGKTHDIQHILTGFSLDELGELGVITVSAAQIAYPTFIFIDLIVLLKSFLASEELYQPSMEMNAAIKTLGYKIEVIQKGLTIGKAAKPLFPIKWEEGLERPLDEWRQELNIQPVTEGYYSWYTRPELLKAIE